jgi:hypothetical protein
MTTQSSIRSGLVYPSYLLDILENVDIDLDLTDIKNVPIIRKVLEADGDIYDMTDAEMHAELVDMHNEIKKESEREAYLEDFSKCTYEEFDNILREVVGDHSAREILAIDNVHLIVNEYFNNAILDKCANWDNDDEFNDALIELLNNEGVCNVLEASEVYSILSEHFNTEVLDKWIARQKK